MAINLDWYISNACSNASVIYFTRGVVWCCSTGNGMFMNKVHAAACAILAHTYSMYQNATVFPSCTLIRIGSMY